MTKLNDNQLVILSAASRRRDFSVYPLPHSVKRGDGPKILKQLLSKGFIEEAEAVGDAPVWRQHEDGYGVTLVLTDGRAISPAVVGAHIRVTHPIPEIPTITGIWVLSALCAQCGCGIFLIEKNVSHSNCADRIVGKE